MRRSVGFALVIVGGLAGAAAAQSAAPPVEIGLDASALLAPDRGGLAGGPRVIVNVDGRNALELTASLQALSPPDGLSQQATDRYLVAFKRVVHAAGPARVFTTLGGGLERTLIVNPGVTFPGPPAVTFPPASARFLLPAVTVGSGADVRLGRRAAIVLASSVVLTDRVTARLSAGVVVPVGAYPPRPARLAPSVPWARLSDGDRVWVTTGEGHEITGEVVFRSALRLDIRTQHRLASLTPDEVRAIDTTDPIRDGIRLGATIGGLSALGGSVLVTYLVCGLQEVCGVSDVLLFNGVFTAMGVGIGAATGALADSLRERRVPLYRRAGVPNITAAPVLGKERVGVGAHIRW